MLMHRLIIMAAVLGLGASAPALAQTTKYHFKGDMPVTAAASSTSAASTASAATATLAKAPFGCDARAPRICHFRVYYARGSRNVVLPAGMKQRIPGVTLGQDSYCIDIDKKPAPNCVRNAINANYNS
jgi:hypothetical protein